MTTYKTQSAAVIALGGGHCSRGGMVTSMDGRTLGQVTKQGREWVIISRTEHVHEFTREGSIGCFTCTCGESRTAQQMVLNAEFTGDTCESFAGLMTNRSLNTGGGRPSDAARDIVRLHQGLGCEGFRARYEEGANSQSLEAAAWSLIQP